MPGTWLTQRPFDEVIHELAFIVPRIDLQWFAGARWLQRKDVSIDEVTLYDWATLSRDGQSVVGITICAIDFEEGHTSEGEVKDQVESQLYNVRF